MAAIRAAKAITAANVIRTCNVLYTKTRTLQAPLNAFFSLDDIPGAYHNKKAGSRTGFFGREM